MAAATRTDTARTRQPAGLTVEQEIRARALAAAARVAHNPGRTLILAEKFAAYIAGSQE
jgi:hypothetical protein